ncbi:Disintegrin and metalloproteinase domain-containing protein 15 [Exaiptasia diaphana]|nr:Disintegrin and metalloproteinase domain-containing protein 15 [Exaiptasia diaphana]
MCKKKDPCCQPHNCQLKPSAMCSDSHHSCCKDCQYKKQGSLCRAVKTDCDVPEYCPGDSRDLIIANTNRGSVVKNTLSPRIEARYVRINPQYWNGWNCLRTEFLGCSADKVNPTMPTPLKAYNDFCIVPKNETCKPSENSRIVFKSGYECKENYMEFKLDSNGILWHECSQHRVCPENGGTWNGVKLVISSSCKDEDSKFVRTSKHSLKHVKSGKCVHPSGGWPGNGRELVLWGGCDITRLEINFIKPDCMVPLGIRSGAIPDKQMTASSTRGNDLPSNARLHSSKYWCAAEKKKTEYLQIDLGTV